MRAKCRKKLPSCILCMTLVVAMALFITGCHGGTSDGAPSASGTEAGVPAKNALAESNALKEGNELAQGNVLGEGGTTFLFTVVDKEGGETQFEIHTDKETVGDALLELELIGGEESGYGLYVKTVNGITVDYDEDGVYWAFYINGEYAPTGVDATAITEGDSYSFRVE